MNKDKSEVEKLFEGLPNDNQKAADIFDTKVEPNKEADIIPAKDENNDDEPRKNRRHRRWEAQLSDKEKELIAREARLEALAEAGIANKTGDVDERLLRIYGNETPEGKMASKLLQDALKDFSEKAKNEAIREIEERQRSAQREEQQFEKLIDDELDNIEDEFNVDITSNSPAARKARRELLEMVQSLSPKDEDGTITNYADFTETFKLYQLRKSGEKQDSSIDRRKEIANRSMDKSGNVDAAKAENDATLAYLRENGIRV